ncbi:VOC family protein [Salinigranum halophilum]|jgi:catechol 2,3-dioxygenase-like lactoylglutathione lyase family enzyme|uniref:VOC family protein n=1 Tax=Salinigranum halophilum TaxID=2565931 RepID=UPI0010A88CCB|nr:VOC family protein [Salinigranum halophilum]
MHVTGIDHLVLYATDVERTCEFYAETLDVATVETFAGGRVALSFGTTKLNLHPAGDEYEPHAADPAPGSADFCLVVDEPIRAVVERIESAGVSVVEAPGTRTGARGEMASVYVRDPDGNLVEFAHYREPE